MQDQDFTTVATFLHPTWGEVIKAKLESEGVECRYLNENIVLAHNGLATAVGGVKLQVEHVDVDRANALLDDYQQATISDDDDDLSPIDYGEFEDIPDRVRSSDEVHFRSRAALLMALMILLIYIALNFEAIVYHFKGILGLTY